MKNGITKAQRVPKPDKLTKLIRETGFGIGYYYLSGAISNE